MRWTWTGASLLVAVLVLVIAWVLRVSEAKRAIADCDNAVARADWPEAIMSARTAAEARCPAWCVSEIGYARLYAIAKDAENRADDATAFAAWRAVRAATLATAVFDVQSSRRERADVELARIGHRLDATAAAGGVPASAAASEERLKAALASQSVPSGMTYFLLAVGGALFFAGAIRFARAKGTRVDLATALVGAATSGVGALFF